MITSSGYSRAIVLNNQYEKILKNNVNHDYLENIDLKVNINANYLNSKGKGNAQINMTLLKKLNEQEDYTSTQYQQNLFKDEIVESIVQDNLKELLTEYENNSLMKSQMLNEGHISLSIKQSHKSKYVPLFPKSMPLHLIRLAPKVLHGIKCINQNQCRRICQIYLQTTVVHYFQLQQDLVCYGIELLSEICVVLEKTGKQVNIIGPGCFNNDQIGKYSPFQTNNELKDIKIKVVDINDPYIFQSNNNMWNNSLPAIIKIRRFIGTIGIFFIILTFLLLTIYQLYACRYKQRKKISIQQYEDEQLKANSELQVDVDLDMSINNENNNKNPDWNDLESSMMR